MSLSAGILLIGKLTICVFVIANFPGDFCFVDFTTSLISANVTFGNDGSNIPYRAKSLYNPIETYIFTKIFTNTVYQLYEY